MFNLVRKDEISFDMVAKHGNNARTLLLVWTGLNTPMSHCSVDGVLTELTPFFD